MQKSKIEWCDMTWNPVTGCLCGCPYCYAARQARRFGGHMDPDCPPQKSSTHFLDEPLVYYDPKPHKAPFPFGFEPTFHRYRLDEPARRKKPAIIFVVSMSDLFGEWVPDSWIEQVFDACRRAPQHTYIFLTKNPRRFQDMFLVPKLGITPNMWFGFSVEDQVALSRLAMAAKWLPQNTFISIEPMSGKVDLSGIEPKGVDAYLNFLDGGQYWFAGGNRAGKKLDWLIVGAQTGPGAAQHQPKIEWVDAIVNQCRIADVPVFLKNSISSIDDMPLLQEYPDAILKYMKR